MNHTLNIKARHFGNSYYSEPCNCPLAKSAKEYFNTYAVAELVDEIDVADQLYSHEHYDFQMFLDDEEKAVSLNFSDEIIRTIELTPLNNKI